MTLPLDEPTTVPDVKAQLGIGIDDDTDDLALTPIVAAVNLVVRGLPVAKTADGLSEWPATIVQGATMLAARLLRRRNSPDGVAAFGDQGPVYIQRNDPDVAMLLRLGDWATPAVG